MDAPGWAWGPRRGLYMCREKLATARVGGLGLRWGWAWGSAAVQVSPLTNYSFRGPETAREGGEEANKTCRVRSH